MFQVKSTLRVEGSCPSLGMGPVEEGTSAMLCRV